MVEPQIFQVNGHTLAVSPLNPGASGEPVILVHGITGNIATWQVDPLPSLLEQGPCYALSLPGHFPAVFPSGFRKEQLTTDMLALTMVEAICRIAGERPVTLMGQSTGGFAVLNLAARSPDLVRRVICISGFTHGRWNGFLGLNQDLVRMGAPGKTIFKAIYRLAGLSPGIFKLVMGIYAADARQLYANRANAEAIERSIYNFQQLDLDAMVQYFAVMPDMDITSLLPRIQAPTLVIAGEQDRTVSTDESRRIASLVPNAELAVIPGAGHLSFLERPEEYQKTLSRWLKETKALPFATGKIPKNDA